MDYLPAITRLPGPPAARVPRLRWENAWAFGPQVVWPARLICSFDWLTVERHAPARVGGVFHEFHANA